MLRYRTDLIAALGIMVFSGSAAAQVGSAAPPSPFASERAEARERFRVASELFERQNFDGALAEFERLFELLAGNAQRPLILFNIAQCQEQLGRYELAVTSYRRYLEEMGERATNRDEVVVTLRTLENLLGTLQIESNVAGAEVFVDDRRVGQAPGTIRVAGGRHVVQLRAAGHVPAQQEVQVAGRATRALRFALERIPSSRGLRPVYFWTALGATGTALVAGSVLGGVALAQDGAARERLADPARRFTVTEETRDEVRATALAADVLYATAGAVAIGAGILFVLTDFRGRSPESPRVSLVPWREGRASGLAVGGSF